MNGGSGYSLHIPSLDRIVRETSIRLAQQPTTLPATTGQRPVIEFTSISPGAGKTQFLYYAIALSILPRQYQGYNLNGRNTAVVVIDADDRFEVTRLAEVMASYITLQQKATPRTANAEETNMTIDVETDDLVAHALQHVHIFRPQSLSSLVATFNSLDAYLFDLRAHQSSQRPLGAIILDGASAFFWQHRAEEDAARLKDAEQSGTSTTADGKYPTTPAYSHLLAALKRALTTFDCPVIYTSQSTVFAGQERGTSNERTSSRTHLRPLLPPNWTSFPTVRLLFERAKTVQFAPGMSAEEAWAERELRQEVVDRGIFVAKVVGGDRSAKFEFAVRRDGVFMPD